MGTWFRDNLRAIDEHPALRAYAAILAVAHALTGVAWFTFRDITMAASGDDGVCWPFFPQCNVLRTHLSPEGVRDLVVVYIGLGLSAAALFLLRRALAAHVTFLVTTLAGVGLYALDYRLRTNETYMLSWTVVVFLVAPRKPQALQALVALFYFWAGTLKVNAEWVSGGALYAKPYLVPEALIPAACVYVLFLEMAIVWGLFSSRPRWRWVVYAQFVLFHAVSWRVVGYYYPLLMFGITAIYPLVWRLAPADTLTFSALRKDRGLQRTVAGVAALFSSFQLVPHLFSGDTAITGEGRLLALHMFDARVVCEGGATVRSTTGQTVSVPLIDPKQVTRIRCDPINLLAQARRLCRKAAKRSDVAGVDVAIDARRTTDERMQPLMHIDDFCNKSIEYSPWHHNDWIGRD